jgi:HlyD family secretion protein
MSAQNLNSELSKLRIDRSKKSPSRSGFGGALVLLLLIAAAGGGGFFYYTKANAAIPVKVIRAERIDASAAAAMPAGEAVLTAGGYIIPRDKIEISSKIVGRVKEIYVDRGVVVKEGDLLMEIEDEEYQAQVRMAESRLASSRARLAELKAGSRPQEIRAAQADVEAAESHVVKAKADLERVKNLYEEKIMSAIEFDQYQNSYDVAKSNLEAAKERARLIEIGPRREVIDSAQAQVREAEASLEYAKTQLSFTRLYAPISGTILEKIAEKGELVTNSNFGGTRGPQSSVVAMADLQDLQVELDLNENDLPKVEMGQKAQIRMDAMPDRVYDGIVDEIAPQADRQKATVQVKVKIVNPDEKVRPEVNARVTFLSEEQPVAAQTAEAAPAGPKIMIPKSAIVQGADGPSVFIASEGEAVARRITVKRESSKGVEIEDGLMGTELLIIEPLDKMSDGAKIMVQG